MRVIEGFLEDFGGFWWVLVGSGGFKRVFGGFTRVFEGFLEGVGGFLEGFGWFAWVLEGF